MRAPIPAWCHTPRVSVAPRRAYAHRLRQLVTLAGPVAVNDLSVPRSTVATWRKRGSRHVASSRLFDLGDIKLRAQLVTAERRLSALRALIHLLLVLVRVRDARLVNDRLPDGHDKEKLLAAIGRAAKIASRRRALALVGLTDARFRAWTRRQGLCALDDKSSCPRQHTSRLTRQELSCMRTMAESRDLQHMPVSVLSAHAKRIGRVFASAATWARMIRKNGWRRPRKRIHPRPSRIGIRSLRIGELLHIDVTVIRLLDGSKVFVQAVIDNFSRRILAWRIGPTLESARTASVLREAVRVLVERGATAVTLIADSGVENVNAAVDGALGETGVTRLLAQVEVAWSNSMIEAWIRSLKHNWLFLNSLGSLGAVERLVAFYVRQHNEVMPNAALGGRTPDEVFRGEVTDLAERLREKHKVAMAERLAANRRLQCSDCVVPLRRHPIGDQSATIVPKQE